MTRDVHQHRRLVKRSDAISLAVVSSHIALVLLPVYLAVAFEPSPLLILWWLWFGLLMQGLLNLMHECAHLHVFKHRSSSEWLARWILGPLMVVSFDRYREVHWAHHQQLGGAGDPKYSYRLDIRGWRFASFLLRSLLLVEAARKLLYVHGDAGSADRAARDKPGKRQEPGWVWLLRTAVFHALLLASLYLTAWLSAERSAFEALRQLVLGYGFVYIYGVLSITILAANLRAIAEHQLRDDGDDEAGSAALRNLKTSFLSRLIFGAYGFAEHATHHWNPGVPSYLLAEETRSWIDQKAHALPRYGYTRAILQAIALPRCSDSVRLKSVVPEHEGSG